MSDTSATPPTPPTPEPDAELGELEAAFSREFGGDGAPGDAPAALPVDEIPGQGEGGEGEGPSPADPQPPLDNDKGGATEFQASEEPEPRYAIGDDSAPDLTADSSPTQPPGPGFDPAAPVDLSSVLRDYLGREVTYEDSRSLLELMQFTADLQSLPPEAQQTIAQIVAERGVPDPLRNAQPQPQPRQQRPAPTPDDDFDDWGDERPTPPAPDPQTAQQLAELQAWRAQQEQQAQQQHQQWIVSEARAGLEDFATSAPVPLSPEQLVVLEQKAMQSGRFALEMQRSNNPRQAWKATLEETLYADPVFRQRVIDAQVAAAAQEREAEFERQRRAASVSAGGGVVPSPAEFAPPADMADAVARAAKDLDKLSANGQP